MAWRACDLTQLVDAAVHRLQDGAHARWQECPVFDAAALSGLESVARAGKLAVYGNFQGLQAMPIAAMKVAPTAVVQTAVAERDDAGLVCAAPAPAPIEAAVEAALLLLSSGSARWQYRGGTFEEQASVQHQLQGHGRVENVIPIAQPHQRR